MTRLSVPARPVFAPAGLGVALATPFAPDHAVDLPGLVGLVRHVAAGGAQFVVALGSTGEAAMLADGERDRVVDAVREHCGALGLVVGTGASSTALAAARTARALALGADAALVVVPPYVRPTADGIVAHFAAIAEAAPGLPLIAYTVPARTGQSLDLHTALRLFELPAVLALKDSSGNMLQTARLAAELPPARALLAGDDALLLPIVAVGGRGVISVAGNLVPRWMRELCDAALAGDLPAARRHQRRLMPLFDALAAEPNPIPVKAGLALLGLAGPDVRLPLLPASPATHALLESALAALQGVPDHVG